MTFSTGELVACADAREFSLWNLVDGSLPDRFLMRGAYSVEFANDKTALIAAGQEGVNLVSLEKGDQICTFTGTER